MKILFISNSGEGLPIVHRLRREGVDAGIYLHHSQYKSNYKNIIPKVTFGNLLQATKTAKVIIFDMSHFNERTKQDIALLKLFGCPMSAKSVFGAVADKLRRSHKVIGSTAYTEELEFDRRKGIALAAKLGFAIPDMHTFKTLKEGASFLKSRKDLWVFKPLNNQDLDLSYVETFAGELRSKMLDEWQARLDNRCDYILQEKIDGTEISSEVWVGEKGTRHFNHTLESKRLMDNDLGPATGSQTNLVWVERDKMGLCVPLLTKMAEHLRQQGYIGPCDANCIISGGKPYFLEWTIRFGYDALYCLLTLLKGRLSNFFLNDFNVDFRPGYVASERLTIPPYPYATPLLRKQYARDVQIAGKLEHLPHFWAQDVYSDGGKLKCAGADGILGVVTAYGENPQTAWGRLYNSIKKIKVSSYPQWRTDGLRGSLKRLRELKVA